MLNRDLLGVDDDELKGSFLRNGFPCFVGQRPRICHEPLASFQSTNDKFIIPSPIKEKPLGVAEGVVKSQWTTPPTVMISQDFGSKEEVFFYSHPW